VAFRLIPREERFYDDFVALGEQIRLGAGMLEDMLAGDRPIWDKADEIKEVEHKCDFLTHEIIQRLHRTFVTPLDREDIRSLAVKLDDLVDDAEEAGKRILLYKLSGTNDTATLLARILHEQTLILAKAVPLLENVPKHGEEIRRNVLEIHRLENEADDALSQALAVLYDGVADIPTLISQMRWGELVGLLEDATDRLIDEAGVRPG